MRTTLVCLFASCAFALAQTPPDNPERQQWAPARLFSTWDKNSDGKLSKEEFPYPYFFKQYDKDGDGLLSQGEAAEIKPIGKAAPPSPGATTTPPSPPTATDIKPRPHGDEATKAGLKPEVLSKLDIVMEQAVANKEVSGVIGLIHRDGQRGYFEAFGWQDIEAQKPMPKDAIFRLQSMSKPVVSACAMALHDAGLFTLDEPISKHCPEWTEPKVLENGQLVSAKFAITPRMLMSHSSGLYYGDIAGGIPTAPDPASRTSLKALSESLAKQPLKFHPGTAYQYGHSIDVLGRYIEAVEGKPLDLVMRERILGPLKMTSTDFWVHPENAGRICRIYTQPKPGVLQRGRDAGKLTEKPTLFMGGQGLCASTEDYERFCRTMMNRGELDGVRVLKAETVDLMFQNHLKPEIGQKYGLGGVVDLSDHFAKTPLPSPLEEYFKSMSSDFISLGLLASLALILCVPPVAAEVPLRLVQEGKTGYRIAIPEKAVEADRHAASELAQFLKQSTGAEFSIVPESEAGTGPVIYVGFGKRSLALADEADAETMGPDEFIMETHPPHLVLAGGNPRGTLYAVYSFLEEVVGCRWYSASFSRISSHPSLDVGPLNSHQKPAFEYRQALVYDSLDGDWSVRNKINGHASRLDDKRGGQIGYMGFVHTFFDLVPPAKHFANHPDYYSEIGGKRTSERAQLCLTNPDVVDVVSSRVIEMTKDAPLSTIVSVSQNDWNGWCSCAGCRKVIEEEGAVSGALVRFVNQVAERVEKVRPGIAIDTLAYQESRKPPRLARPRPNVIIRLCSVECSFSRPLVGDGPNRAFADDIAAWSKICQRLYLWDYVTNFSHFIQPHPNFRVLQPNLAFFASHGVKGVLAQGNYKSPAGEFEELRSWVLARLMWNPQADTDKLVDDFINGYYGPAATSVRQYFDLIHDAVVRSGVELRVGTPPTAAFLSPEMIAQADKLWESAEQAVAQTKDRGLQQRVRAGRLPVYYVMIARESAWQQSVPSWKPSISGTALRQRFSEYAAVAGATRISEKRSMDEFRDMILKMDRRAAAPPRECESLRADQWIDSRNELPAALFDRLDADKDGFVSEAELTTLWKQE